MNMAVSRLLFFIPFIVIAAIVLAAILVLPPTDPEGTVTYDNKEGVIIIEFNDPPRTPHGPPTSTTRPPRAVSEALIRS